MQLEFLTSVDSTMAYLQRLPDDVTTDDLYVVVAETQTAGRGQRGTHWESESGKNLTLGLRVYPTFLKADEQFRLSEVTALAIAEALDLYTDGISIKWPNDIYWNDRKICGMLLEHDLRGSEIACTRIGPGININQRQFFSDAPNPVSLYQILGHDMDLTTFLYQFLQRFISLYRPPFRRAPKHRFAISPTFISTRRSISLRRCTRHISRPSDWRIARWHFAVGR